MIGCLVLLFAMAVSAAECCGCASNIKCTGQNEIFLEYGGCELLCSDKNPVCQPTGAAGCFCRAGFVRDDITRLCVERQYCSPVTICNDKNEIFSHKKCEFTCQNQNSVICPEKPTPGCQCVEGTVRNEITGQCIKPCYCPKRCNKYRL